MSHIEKYPQRDNYKEKFSSSLNKRINKRVNLKAVRDRLPHSLLFLLNPRQLCNGFCTRTPAFASLRRAKTVNTRALPFLGHRSLGEGVPCPVTAFWLKYQDPDRMLSRVPCNPCRLDPSLKLPARQFL